MQDDTGSSLSEIRQKSGMGTISRLIDIQKHNTLGEKSYEWAENLRCLFCVKSSRKRRRSLDSQYEAGSEKILRIKWIPMREKDYVAVSYTWQPAENENPAVGGYIIQSPELEDKPSKVRDIVLDRVIRYATHSEVKMFWIDGESIDQDNDDEKTIAVQSMDLVYSRSEYPLGLLSVCFDSSEQLDLLWRLLHQQAWIFQEDYRASMKMTLLIRTSVKRIRPAIRKKLGGIPGELKVNSAEFREAATLFCLAYAQEFGNKQDTEGDMCDRVLKRAGKYKILHECGKMREGMSPTIFRDIGCRGVEERSDLLAIGANCCCYSARLNTRALAAAGSSLSLCILVLYLLNGEIIKNGEGGRRLLSRNIFNFLKEQSLDVKPPVKGKGLTFIKHCRFADVELLEDGIVASGHLWKIYKRIDTEIFKIELPRDWKKSTFGLHWTKRRWLRQLIKKMKLMGHKELSDELMAYLEEDAQSNGKERPSKQYKDSMATQIVQAITERKPIYLGCPMNGGSYRGIFIPEPDPHRHFEQFYAFTAWSCAREPVDDIPSERNIDKFVSLEVEADGYTSLEVPRLVTKR
ncbi:hypothetical protein AOQ84DRAFT_410481 [Glonium stellatum]|uniref:Heterokaryon incompatibility domain-containing protein n=1 Tax=Glonium stellatum TaxID=574774 RepID=A0A8E2FDS2_9PEZI|nr:hypothetical protein AOQ84DRAFT_410481 [Glonium stellatum]